MRQLTTEKHLRSSGVSTVEEVNMHTLVGGRCQPSGHTIEVMSDTSEFLLTIWVNNKACDHLKMMYLCKHINRPIIIATRTYYHLYDVNRFLFLCRVVILTSVFA